jgi:3-phosphoshikimate 1-carboxyvinyltransferase
LKNYFLSKRTLIEGAQPQLPASKSESNRALIIQALSKAPIALENLSNARDTQTMLRLLASTEETLDVLDAGTTMRFLTAFHAIGSGKQILTGTERMQNRPIGILVSALQALGARICYLKKEGYPPLEIDSFEKQLTDTIEVEGHISSQFISALILIAPMLERGLHIQIKNTLISEPYVQMTLALMRHFGADALLEGNKISIKPQSYHANQYRIESDWSAASYWYSFFALSEAKSMFIAGLRQNSFQGDAEISRIMEQFGVRTSFETNGVQLTKSGSVCSQFEWNMLPIPDLTQTIAVLCSVLKIPATMHGVQSLLIKETDRVAALKNELAKIGCQITYQNHSITLNPSNNTLPDRIQVNTYEDHRMAMAFAPLCLLMEVEIEEAEVVNKSYPDFWKEVERNLAIL